MNPKVDFYCQGAHSPLNVCKITMFYGLLSNGLEIDQFQRS